MASIGCDPNGRKRILFVAGDGSRKTIRLGKVTLKQAEATKVKIEQLQLSASGITGVVDDETARWLAGLDDGIYKKLADVGLVAKRPKVESVLLGAYLQRYADDRIDVKQATRVVYRHTRGNLVDFFGPDKPLRDITPGDADQWRLYLIKQGLADNTIRRRCGIAKQFFRAAVRRKLVSSNPFEDLKSTTQGNPKRFYFITKAEAQKVLDACPDAEWRLIFGLARFGGLRCPSEVVRLKWVDVDFEKQRFTVHASKTEHHADGGIRDVPMFPELKPLFQDAFEQARDGAVYCIDRYNGQWSNVGVHMARIIKRAGLKPWPKLFQNLRSTRETELTEDWPEYKVCKWIGNSRTIAREHYLQVTDDDFKRAAGIDNQTNSAAQNPAHQRDKLCHTESYTENESVKLDAKRHLVTQCDNSLGGTGFEPVTSCV
jgi:integrase